MTVRELIATLHGFHPDARVVVRGYEAGYDDPLVRPAMAWPDWPSGGGVYGRHAAEEDVDPRNIEAWDPVVVIDQDSDEMRSRVQRTSHVTQKDGMK